MTRYPWDQILPAAIDQAEKLKARFNTSPTLRGLFYALVTLNLLPNTLNAYKALSRFLTKARKTGKFPWSLLRDETRKTLGGDRNGTDMDTILRWANDATQDAVTGLTDAIDKIEYPSFDYTPYVWAGQSTRVIICLEKEALDRVVLNITKRYKIQINIMRGYSSATNMMKLAVMVNGYLKEGLDVEVLLLTDYDPSGEDIVRYVQETLNYEYGLNCNVSKILLTREQIDEYDLPSVPESASERAKMMRDTRFQNWQDGFFRVELDAMVAVIPDEFVRIIQEAIAEHYDEEIAEENNKQVDDAEEKYIQEMNDMNEELGELIGQIRGRLEALE